MFNGIQTYDIGVHWKFFWPKNTCKELLGIWGRVRVYIRLLGSKGMEFKMFYKTLEDLTFDPGLLMWALHGWPETLIKKLGHWYRYYNTKTL